LRNPKEKHLGKDRPLGEKETEKVENQIGRAKQKVKDFRKE